MQRFLKENPGKPYTCLRTCGARNRVIQLVEHENRLKMNAEFMFGVEFQIDLKMELKKWLEGPIGINNDSELAILVIVDYSSGALNLLFYGEELAQSNYIPPNTNAACFGNIRINPTIKNTSWITERAYIDAKKPPSITEMLLYSNNCIYEGTKSSFFAIVEEMGKLWVTTTPFDLVLKGTVAEAIVNICHQNEIPFRFQLIDLTKDKLVGAFLTSSLRYIQCIIELIVIGEPDVKYSLTAHPIADRIRQLLITELIGTSTCLF